MPAKRRYWSLYLGVVSVLLPRGRAGSAYERPSFSGIQCPIDLQSALGPRHSSGCPLPIDETVPAEPALWSPWTHRPVCLNSTNGAETRYCVFTNSRHGEFGISIITTPETAANSIYVLNEPGLSLPVYGGYDESRTEELPCEIVDIPGKGKGVVARRRISAFETIMTDHASLLIDMNFPEAVTRKDGYDLLDLAAAQLADPSRVLGLGRSTKMARNVVEDVLRTNAFHTPLAGEQHMGLYPDVSRINHACNPNAHTRFLLNKLAAVIIASKDIEAGEEISISYLNFGLTSAERQAALQRWEFNCSCSLCAAPDAQKELSDRRRIRIGRLREAVLKAYRDGDARKAIADTHEILGLLQAEELLPLYSEQYDNLARIHWVIKERDTAVQYAQKSLDLLAQQGYLEPHPRNLETLLSTFET